MPYFLFLSTIFNISKFLYKRNMSYIKLSLNIQAKQICKSAYVWKN